MGWDDNKNGGWGGGSGWGNDDGWTKKDDNSGPGWGGGSGRNGPGWNSSSGGGGSGWSGGSKGGGGGSPYGKDRNPYGGDSNDLETFAAIAILGVLFCGYWIVGFFGIDFFYKFDDSWLINYALWILITGVLAVIFLVFAGRYIYRKYFAKPNEEVVRGSRKSDLQQAKDELEEMD